MKQRFDVTGMSCTACSSHVERAVSALAGVSSVNVDLMQNRMLVDYDSTKLSEAEICAAVTAAGYGARPAGAAGGSAALPPAGAAGSERRRRSRLPKAGCYHNPPAYGFALNRR